MIKIPVISKKNEINTGKSLRPAKINPDKISAIKQLKMPTNVTIFADFSFIFHHSQVNFKLESCNFKTIGKKQSVRIYSERFFLYSILQK